MCDVHAQLCPTLHKPMDCSPARLLCPCGFSRQDYWSGLPFSSPFIGLKQYLFISADCSVDQKSEMVKLGSLLMSKGGRYDLNLAEFLSGGLYLLAEIKLCVF